MKEARDRFDHRFYLQEFAPGRRLVRSAMDNKVERTSGKSLDSIRKIETESTRRLVWVLGGLSRKLPDEFLSFPGTCQADVQLDRKDSSARLSS